MRVVISWFTVNNYSATIHCRAYYQTNISCGSTKFAVCLDRKDIKQRKEKGVNIRKVRAKGQE